MSFAMQMHYASNHRRTLKTRRRRIAAPNSAKASDQAIRIAYPVKAKKQVKAVNPVLQFLKAKLSSRLRGKSKNSTS